MNLWNLPARVFGIRDLDIAGAHQFTLTTTAGTITLILLGVLAISGVCVSVITYSRTTESIPSKWRWFFGLARAFVYVLLAIALSGLVIIVELSVDETERSLVIIDNSLSMGIQESGERRIDPVKKSVEILLPALAGVRITDLRTLDDKRLTAKELKNLEPSIDRTSLTGILEKIGRDTRAEVSEILFFTDGRDTVRTDYGLAAAALKSRSIRLYPVIAGTQTEFSDLRIAAASATPYCRAFDQLVVRFKLHQRGCTGKKVKVEVVEAEETDKVLAASELTLTDDPVGQGGTLVMAPPRKSGDVHLVVRATQLDGEIVTRNNQVDLFTRIVSEPIKMLYIDNFPRAEFRHIKQSLDRDPNIALTLLNRMPGGVWLVQGPNLLEKPELGFPAELGELLKYDVLILGSISRGYFSARDRFEERKLTNIAHFVSGRGGGLIVLGGHRSFGHGKYKGSPIEDLLPFRIPKHGDSEFQTQEIQAELHPLGKYHPIAQLGHSPDESATLWQELPRLQGCNVVGEARPGAEVIAVSSEAVDGQKPILLASQQYGAGRVFACTSYSTYRWRLGTPLDKGNLLARFWAQVVRYVAPDPRLVANALNIQTDKPHYVRGETAQVELRPLDPYYAPLRNAELQLTVSEPGEESAELILKEDPNQKGVYPAEIRLDHEGAYQLEASGPKSMKENFTLTVHISSEEFFDARPKRESLQQLAEATGGKLLNLKDTASLVNEIRTEADPKQQRMEIPLWDSSLLLALLVCLALGEWYFRKRSGLA